MSIKDFRYRHFEPVLAQDFELVPNLITRTGKAIIALLAVCFIGGLSTLLTYL